jgi:hypothetical protein
VDEQALQHNFVSCDDFAGSAPAKTRRTKSILEVYRDYAGEQTAKARLPPEHAALIPVSKRQPAAAVQNQIKLICLVEC